MQYTICQQYIRSKTLFKGDRDVLRPSYIPDVLPHREEQIRELARILVTALEGQRPSNVLLFGKTGTGKTACMKDGPPPKSAQGRHRPTVTTP